MDYETLRGALLNMAADRPGSLACYGCGAEHNCQTEGCAILREAIATMEQLYKDVGDYCELCVHADVSSDEEPCKSCYDHAKCKARRWQWRGVQKQKEATP